MRAACIAALLLLGGCARPAPEEPPAAPIVTTATLAPAPLALYENLPGRVVALRTAEIRPQISGIVERRLFEQGADVKAGQPLFQINAAPFKAEADVAVASLQRMEAVLKRASAQVQRLTPLVESDAVSGQAFDDAVAQRDQAAADVAQGRATLARRRLDVGFATVEAPISGRVEQVLVTEGALVSATDTNPMTRIQQIDKVYVDLRRPAASYEALRATAANGGQPGADAPVAILRDNGQVYEAKGRILFSGATVDAGTGDVLLRVLVDNPRAELMPGMFVQARVLRERHAQALTVPQQAVVRAEGKPHVWTVDGKNVAHLVAVELGGLAERRYHVRSGVVAGQRVVVEGMARLAEGAPVTARDWKAAAVPTAVAAR